MDDDAVAEVKQLYEQVLKVRLELLHDAHPDAVATKFSLGELLASLLVSLGEEDGANVLREDIVKAYGVQEMDEAPDGNHPSCPL